MQLLLLPQGDDRIDARRAAGGDETGDERDDREQHRCAGEDERIRGRDLIELARDAAADGERAGQADREPDREDDDAFAENQIEHRAPAAAQRRADADLARAVA